MPLLGYERWENFEKAVKRAMVSAETSGVETADHFREVTKMVELGSKAQRPVRDYMLTRYACYLIAQNGDPKEDIKQNQEGSMTYAVRVTTDEYGQKYYTFLGPFVFANGPSSPNLTVVEVDESNHILGTRDFGRADMWDQPNDILVYDDAEGCSQYSLVSRS